jgi:hypothetical protein
LHKNIIVFDFPKQLDKIYDKKVLKFHKTGKKSEKKAYLAIID